MTQFTNEVEKQKALLALEEWRTYVKFSESDCWRGTRIVKFNDESIKVFETATGKLLKETKSPHRRRTLINMMFKPK